MKIELLFFDGCPNVQPAREVLVASLAELGLDVPIEERLGDYRSPTIAVDGADVMGGPTDQMRACRLDLPTQDKVVAALRCAISRQS